MVTQQLDQGILNLAKAIRQTETGGNYKAKGKSGEYGGYQFTEPTWNKLSQKYLGHRVSLRSATPEQQNEVVYKQLKEWKDQGYNIGQVASMWNAGEGEPDAYLGNFSNGKSSKGVNKYGVKYNVPAYATSVASAYQTLKRGGIVGMDPQNPSSILGTQVERRPYSGIGSSVTNFGKDVAQGLYLGLLGGQKSIDSITKQYLDNADTLTKLAAKQNDKQLKERYTNMAIGMIEDAQKVGGSIIGETRTPKQIVADALGTLGFATVAGTPTFLGGKLAPVTSVIGKTIGASKAASTIGGRLAFGTAVGAGAGAQSTLSDNKSLPQVAKSAAIGGVVGVALGGTVEAIGAGLRKLVQTRFLQNRIGNIYNRELQPPNQDLVKDLERHAQSLGQRVANEVDELGKAVYKGSYRTMAKQAEQQISKNSNMLKGQIKDIKTVVNSTSFKKSLIDRLQEEFGFLDERQLATIEAELKRLPVKMKPLDLLKQRQIVDAKIPKGFWIEPNPQRAFIGNVRYYLRNLMKDRIEKTAPTVAVRQINQKIGLAIDVKDLAYLQEAIRMKGKPGGIFIGSMVGRILDRTIFNPTITTNVAQGLRGLGQKRGGTTLRNIGVTSLSNRE